MLQHLVILWTTVSPSQIQKETVFPVKSHLVRTPTSATSSTFGRNQNAGELKSGEKLKKWSVTAAGCGGISKQTFYLSKSSNTTVSQYSVTS